LIDWLTGLEKGVECPVLFSDDMHVVVTDRAWTTQVDLQSVLTEPALDIQSLCGSVKSGRVNGGHSDRDAVGVVDIATGGYSEVPIAVAMHWTRQQRKMILLEQFLAAGNVGRCSCGFLKSKRLWTSCAN